MPSTPKHADKADDNPATTEGEAPAKETPTANWDGHTVKLTKEDLQRGYYAKHWNELTVYQLIDYPQDFSTEDEAVAFLADRLTSTPPARVPLSVPVLDRFGNRITEREP